MDSLREASHIDTVHEKRHMNVGRQRGGSEGNECVCGKGGGGGLVACDVSPHVAVVKLNSL